MDLGKQDASRHSSDSVCSALSCMIGAILIAVGISLMWWADLDTKQSEQLATVRREVDTWDKLHKNLWQLTQVCAEKKLVSTVLCFRTQVSVGAWTSELHPW